MSEDSMLSELAVNGGTPVREEPIWTWPVIDEETRQAVADVLESRRLTQFSSPKVREFEEAFAEFEKAVELDSDVAWPAMILAATYFEFGRKTQGEKLFKHLNFG